MPGRGVALIAFLTLALGAGVGAPAATAPQPDAVAACRQHVESGYAPLLAPRGDRDLRLGRLAFIGLARGASFRGAPDYEYEGRLYFLLKSPPLLSTGGPVTVAVAPPFRDAVRIGVGGLRGFHHTIRYQPCAPDRPAFSYDGTIGRWTGWSGGFIAARRVCAKLQIWDGARVAYRHVSLGKRCP